jgi:ribosome-associated translation inhibitor RaiA
MQIQINTDHNIEGHEALAARIGGMVASVLHRFSDHITRVEVHLSNENGAKGGQGHKRCMIEARLEERKPVAVTHQARTLDQAVRGAAGKLTRMIESPFGPLRNQRTREAPAT